MRYFPFNLLVVLIALAAVISYAKPQEKVNPFPGLGSQPTQQDMGNLAWASGPSGKDLPAGKGTAKEGLPIYYGKCVMCHGANLEGVNWAPMAFSPYMGVPLGGGNSVPTFKHAPGQVTTMAYAVPWATPLFNTIAVEMPIFRPGTLTADEVYSLTALVLFKNGLIKEDEVMDRDTLPKVQMPDRKGFPASDEIYMGPNRLKRLAPYGIVRDRYETSPY